MNPLFPSVAQGIPPGPYPRRIRNVYAPCLFGPAVGFQRAGSRTHPDRGPRLTVACQAGGRGLSSLPPGLLCSGLRTARWMPTHIGTPLKCAAGYSPLRGCDLVSVRWPPPKGAVNRDKLRPGELVHRPETARCGGRINRRQRPLPNWPQSLGLGFPVVAGPHWIHHDSMPIPHGSLRMYRLPTGLRPIPSRGYAVRAVRPRAFPAAQARCAAVYR